MNKLLLSPVVLSIMISTAACSGPAGDAPDDTARSSAPLYAATALKWPGNTVSVCWDNASDATKRGWVQDSIARTWQDAANISFVGWGDCTAGQKGVHITVEDVLSSSFVGTGGDGQVGGMHLNFDFGAIFCASTIEACVRATAIHEFGHALGFEHEQDRPDNGGRCTRGVNGQDSSQTMIGPYDPNSVMNYCNPNPYPLQLSAGDIYGVQTFYGAKPSGSLTTGGMCVTSWGADGLNLFLYHCFGGQLQQWLGQVGGIYTLAYSPGYLGVSSLSAGAPLEQEATSVNALSLQDPVGDWTVSLIGIGGRCLTAAFNTNQPRVVTQDCGSEIKWKYDPVSGHLSTNDASQCLRTNGYWSPWSSEELVLGPCAGAPSFTFAGGSLSVTGSQLCAQPVNGSLAAGTTYVMAPCAGSLAQQLRVESSLQVHNELYCMTAPALADWTTPTLGSCSGQVTKLRWTP